jgi:hypothetical protein
MLPSGEAERMAGEYAAYISRIFAASFLSIARPGDPARRECRDAAAIPISSKTSNARPALKIFFNIASEKMWTP